MIETRYLMNETEANRALVICDEFGGHYDGIRYRAELVLEILADELATFGQLADASEDLLTGVNPVIASRIAPAWKQ